jgi:hypothetical protein
MKKFFLASLFSVILGLSAPAIGQETGAALVQKIVLAQGLEEMFEQQIAAQRDSMKSYASKLFDQAIAETGGQSNVKQKAALERFLAKATTLLTSKEITTAWAATYGKNLSNEELRGILRYYQSPIGRKDIAASKVAMLSFSTWINQESQARAIPLVETLVQELKAAMQ